MDRHHLVPYAATPTSKNILDAAQDFGLTAEEARRTLDAALVGPRSESAVAQNLDEVAGALAQEILAKQRRMLHERLS
jgi:hypothetical protein